jgi:hypothetical protein
LLESLLAACTATGPVATASPPAPAATEVGAIPSKPQAPTATLADSEASASAPAAATPTPSPAGVTSIVVDHRSVDLFDDIPDAFLEAAANLRMVFIDRSVGLNISDGLDCLTAPTDEAARSHCRRVDHPDPSYSLDRSALAWSRPGGYDRSRWAYLPWEGNCSSWSDEVECFLRMTKPILGDYDVLSFQFSYLEVAPGSDIGDPTTGFFAGSGDRPDVSELEAFTGQHPGKVFIYWTTSLARGIGSEEARSFNDQVRQYAAAHGQPLFDVADILSHDPQGNPCFDNRDGVTYRDESYPDDGLDLPAICPHYTTETDGGHLGSVSAGKIRVAKAFWVLMAQIAGWRP